MLSICLCVFLLKNLFHNQFSALNPSALFSFGIVCLFVYLSLPLCVCVCMFKLFEQTIVQQNMYLYAWCSVLLMHFISLCIFISVHFYFLSFFLFLFHSYGRFSSDDWVFFVFVSLCCACVCPMMSNYVRQCNIGHLICLSMLACVSISLWMPWMCTCNVTCFAHTAHTHTHTFRPAVIDQNNLNKFYKYLA